MHLYGLSTRKHQRTKPPLGAPLHSRKEIEISIRRTSLSGNSFAKTTERTNSDLFAQGFWALAIHRFGNWRMSVRWKVVRAPLTLLYRILAKGCQIFCGIHLPYTVQVGRRVKLEHFGGMILVARRIGNDVIIRQNTTFGIRTLADLNAKPTIEDDVRIGAGAVIVGDIVVGRGSFIGANAVVDCDVPPNSKVVGNPCRIIMDT